MVPQPFATLGNWSYPKYWTVTGDPRYPRYLTSIELILKSKLQHWARECYGFVGIIQLWIRARPRRAIFFVLPRLRLVAFVRWSPYATLLGMMRCHTQILKEVNQSFHTLAQDVQITRMVNSRVSTSQCYDYSISRVYLIQKWPLGLKKITEQTNHNVYSKRGLNGLHMRWLRERPA
jgi:hypothetical protein